MSLNSKREQMLDRLLARPAMYFGPDQDNLQCLNALMLGYDIGFRDGSGLIHANHSLLPDDFPSFIISRLGEDQERPAWVYRVVNCTNSAEEAWELFKRLYAEYILETHKAS